MRDDLVIYIDNRLESCDSEMSVWREIVWDASGYLHRVWVRYVGVGGDNKSGLKFLAFWKSLTVEQKNSFMKRVVEIGRF